MELIFIAGAALLLMLVGLIGVIVPILPDTLIAWLGLLIFGLGSHFREPVTLTLVIIFLGLSLLGILFEYLLPIAGAKRYKASRYGIWGAIVGLIIGFLIGGLIGIFVGPLVGAILAEYLVGRREQALRSGFGVFAGFMLAIGYKAALIVTMMASVIFSLVFIIFGPF